MLKFYLECDLRNEIKVFFFAGLLILTSMSCKSQVSPTLEKIDKKHQRVNPDDCKVKAELISIEKDKMSIDIKVIEVLAVGFGFQPSLYSDQTISISYLRRIEGEVGSLKSKEVFEGIITSELSLDTNSGLTLKSLEKTSRN